MFSHNRKRGFLFPLYFIVIAMLFGCDKPAPLGVFIEIKRNTQSIYFQTAKPATDIEKHVDFISHDNCKLGKPLDLWPKAGNNQRWTAQPGPEPDSVYLRADTECTEGPNTGSRQRWMSYIDACDSPLVDLWSQRGANQLFRIKPANHIRDTASDGEFRYQDGKMVCLEAISPGKSNAACHRFIGYDSGRETQLSLNDRCDENSAFRMIEASSAKTCEFRALSYDNNLTNLDLWRTFGENQTFQMIGLSNNRYKIGVVKGATKSEIFAVTYSSDPNDNTLSLVSLDEADDLTTEFEFIVEEGELAPAKMAGGTLIAVNRPEGSGRYVSAAGDCGDNQVALSKDSRQSSVNIFSTRWAGYPDSISVKTLVKQNGEGNFPHCPDPFIVDSGDAYYLTCASFDGIKLYRSEKLANPTGYEPVGWMTPEKFAGKDFGRAPEHTYPYNDSVDDTNRHWANCQQRWASETFKLTDQEYMLMFSSPEGGRCPPKEAESDSRYTYIGRHRIGVVFSHDGLGDSAFKHVSDVVLDLGNFHAGEIDPNIFKDNGKYYFLWKQENNHCFYPISLNYQFGDEKDCGGSAGFTASPETVLFIQQIDIDPYTESIQLVEGTRKALLRSGHGLWEDSWVPGGSLIEGPELIKHEDYYYLFYASGRFCTESYAESVARSRSLYGPYEPSPHPFLHTAMLPEDSSKDRTRLKGPGHAGFIQERETKDWYAVFHASEAALECSSIHPDSRLPAHVERRRAYMGKIEWQDGWPVIRPNNFIH
ncbi:family 43 glycosylhydrolase [Veronia pacifica]|uniref:Uncharacterized protein n=1 Tax=Veronia pacifica TaxID=1080227 RepID=A0A1C3ER47_9GAMM|nr:family 43 glycosylhydrolase [Veronia pacifica]ODA35690.1 hypothetical protein A8L45_03500 [Veronia pacifica]